MMVAVENVRLELEGMTCASCAARIEKKLNKLDGVEALVNFGTEVATVSFDPARVRVEELIAAVDAIGYGAAVPRPAADAARAGDAAAAQQQLFRRLLFSIVLSVPLVLFAMVGPTRFDGWEWVAL